MNKYGLIGNNISYSKSPVLHQIIAEIFNIDLTYELFDVNSIEEINQLINSHKIKGFNVTKPYKKDVLKYLDKVSNIVKKTNAVNTIYYKNNKIYGDNTDYYGFKYLIKYHNINIKNKKIAILGTGGAAEVVYYYLKKHTKHVLFVSRTKQNKNTITYENIKKYKFDIIINATPIGTHPNINESPINKNHLSNNPILIDLTYNPSKTKFMSLSSNSYNGLIMLIVQALYAQKRWNKKIKINKKIISQIKEQLNV